MWGVVPAAGAGSRIQPLAFSKELLPVGSRIEGDIERPRAVSEYLLDRMIASGASRVCFVVSPGKSDIVEYFGGSYAGASIAYVIQPRAAGLCDAVFRSLTVVGDDEPVVVGLPDRVWFPMDGLRQLGKGALEFLLFPVERPDRFDAVVLDPDGRVVAIEVKSRGASTNWIWGRLQDDRPDAARPRTPVARAGLRRSVPGHARERVAGPRRCRTRRASRSVVRRRRHAERLSRGAIFAFEHRRKRGRHRAWTAGHPKAPWPRRWHRKR